MMYHRSLRLIMFAAILVMPACADTTAPRPGDSQISAPPPPPTPPAPPPVVPPVLNGTPHIVMASVNGTDARVLSAGGWPAWSPDGRRIAFHHDGNVWVMNADGTNRVSVARGGYPAWSPDGAWIAFSHDAGISRMNVNGSNVTLVVRHNHGDVPNVTQTVLVTKPSWSADGMRITFEDIGIDDQPAQIYVVNVDGSNLGRLNTVRGGTTQYAESDPAWSPDGRTIAHWSYGWGIAAVDVSTGAASTVYKDWPRVVYGAKPAWSADGAQLAFVAHSDTGIPDLWTVNTNGSNLRLLISNAYDASWSPDGKSIAFVRLQ